MHVLTNPSGRRPSAIPSGAGASALAAPLIVRSADFAALRDRKCSRAGLDEGEPCRHAVIACDCPVSTAPPGFDRLSLRTMRRGAEILKLGARRLRLDQDAYLLVNSVGDRSSSYAGDDRVSPMLVVFRPGSLAQCLAAPDAEPSLAVSDPVGFDLLENLQPHGGAVTHHLLRIEHGLRARIDDGLWWEERIALLLSAAVETERELRGRERAMASLKPATRRELLRRVLIASDYIQSSYEQPITLHDIAAAAHLSRFHLVRLFQRAHGVTPHAYLTRKRLAVALRLVSHTQLGLDDIATRAGLGTRSSLFRHLRRQQGSGASALRARADRLMEHGPCTTSA